MSRNLETIDVIRSKSLAQAAQEAIFNLIMSGVLEPGEKLSEASLSERLGVSRGPIREAFRSLEAMGLVQFSKNRGVFVKDITLEEIQELYQVRIGLDAMVGEILAPVITDEQITALREMADQMEMALTENKLTKYFLMNVDFHKKIVSFTQNKKLIDIYERVVNEMLLMRRRSVIESGGGAMSNQEHKEIVDALATRDGKVAAEALAKHGTEGKGRLLETLVKIDSEKYGS
ncbi:FCD domain-containing protein [Pusillimonas sp.]|uniref:FCD domain-containing protein n=1 Tax=Pusillimonas sp. TaxID=3040095 RepID=UPI0037C6242E